MEKLSPLWQVFWVEGQGRKKNTKATNFLKYAEHLGKKSKDQKTTIFQVSVFEPSPRPKLAVFKGPQGPFEWDQPNLQCAHGQASFGAPEVGASRF